MPARRIPPGPGQESAWDYPRPPRVEPTARWIEVRLRGVVVAASGRAQRVLETSHPPSYYLPPADVRTDLLVPAPGRSVCEWKGAARYFDLAVEGERLARVAWCYPEPSPAFAALAGHYAFYPRLLECYVDGERAEPQLGGFYGGWITSHVAGPFKGAPGTLGW